MHDWQKLIASAFPLEPVPRLEKLHLAQGDDIAEEIAGRISGKRWDQVNAEDWANIGHPGTVMRYLTPATFQYYLPSLLLAVWGEPAYQSFGVTALSPQNQKLEARGAWWNSYFALFTEAQRDVVCAFLEHVVATDEENGVKPSSALSVLDLWAVRAR